MLKLFQMPFGKGYVARGSGNRVPSPKSSMRSSSGSRRISDRRACFVMSLIWPKDPVQSNVGVGREESLPPGGRQLIQHGISVSQRPLLPRHSLLRASTGSRREARWAG
jgi:hypothetical protein